MSTEEAGSMEYILEERCRTLRYWLYGRGDTHIMLVVWSYVHIDVTIDGFSVCPYMLRPRTKEDRFRESITFVLETQKRGWYEYLDVIPVADAQKALIDQVIDKYGAYNGDNNRTE